MRNFLQAKLLSGDLDKLMCYVLDRNSLRNKRSCILKLSCTKAPGFWQGAGLLHTAYSPSFTPDYCAIRNGINHNF